MVFIPFQLWGMLKFIGSIISALWIILWWCISSRWVWVAATLIVINSLFWSNVPTLGLATFLPSLTASFFHQKLDHPVEEPIVFETPVHGGLLDGLYSQKLIVRQARANLMAIDNNLLQLLEASEEKHLNITEVTANTFTNFSDILRRYELDHRDWGNKAVSFLYRLSSFNQSMHRYADMMEHGDSWWFLVACFLTSRTSAPDTLQQAIQVKQTLTDYVETLEDDHFNFAKTQCELDQIIEDLGVTVSGCKQILLFEGDRVDTLTRLGLMRAQVGLAVTNLVLVRATEALGEIIRELRRKRDMVNKFGSSLENDVRGISSMSGKAREAKEKALEEFLLKGIGELMAQVR